MSTEQIIKGLEESVKKIEAHYDAKGVPQEKRSIEGKKALELIKWQRDEIERLTIEAGALRGAANSYKMHYENLLKENKYLRERRDEETEHAKDLAITDTVKKMQERLHIELASFGARDKFNKEFFLTIADQIAKEMLEGI
jgi:predicted RNase H-like nuclease (RuvC/YqgF family)